MLNDAAATDPSTTSEDKSLRVHIENDRYVSEDIIWIHPEPRVHANPHQ